MDYTAVQYAAQERLMTLARWSHATGLCPICNGRHPIQLPLLPGECAFTPLHDSFAVKLLID